MRDALGVWWVWAGCAGNGTDGPAPPECRPVSAAPSDDPAAWDAEVDPSVEWDVSAGEPRWTIPSAALPEGLAQASNNNVSLLVAGDTWFLAWRTGPTHFASTDTQLHVVSSDDEGATWRHEHTVALGTDVREPALFLDGDRLAMTFFQGGTNPVAFEPGAVWRSERCGPGAWTDEVIEADTTRVPWDVKERGGELLRTSYTGEHYQDDAVLEVHFEVSGDGGRTWAPRGADPVYTGGNSEAAFEVLRDGGLVAVTRNEDGDETGQGAMVCTAPASDGSRWDCPAASDPQRYDSPELIRHGDDVYLLARRDPEGVFGEDEGLLPYSTRPKRSSVYHVDPATRAVTWLLDLPGAGDTAFVSARRTGPHTWLLANYTSPVDDPDVSWLEGQTSPRGTQIYLLELSFVPRR
jgi:hypothetical protein